jgi:hypothetical protein
MQTPKQEPYLQTSIQQTTIDAKSNCDVHPTRSDPYPPVILLGPPLSHLLALQTLLLMSVLSADRVLLSRFLPL